MEGYDWTFCVAPPAVINGVVYAASDEDTVYAIGNQPTPTTLTATTTGNHQITVEKNVRFPVSGTLSTDIGNLAKQPVYLGASKDETNWFRISANKNTGAQGQYSFSGYITAAGTYYMRAHFAGTTTYTNCVSDPIMVTDCTGTVACQTII